MFGMKGSLGSFLRKHLPNTQVWIIIICLFCFQIIIILKSSFTHNLITQVPFLGITIHQYAEKYFLCTLQLSHNIKVLVKCWDTIKCIISLVSLRTFLSESVFCVCVYVCVFIWMHGNDKRKKKHQRLHRLLFFKEFLIAHWSARCYSAVQ